MVRGSGAAASLGRMRRPDLRGPMMSNSRSAGLRPELGSSVLVMLQCSMSFRIGTGAVRVIRTRASDPGAVPMVGFRFRFWYHTVIGSVAGRAPTTTPRVTSPTTLTLKEISVKTYRIFISHSWAYKEQYKSLIRMLTNAERFSFVDYSVPPDDPIHDADDDERLREEIRNQMSPCHVILILAGVYASYSRWINEEIDLAESGFLGGKAIVAVEPWGAQRTSVRVKNAADRIVRWNTQSIGRAIREVG